MTGLRCIERSSQPARATAAAPAMGPGVPAEKGEHAVETHDRRPAPALRLLRGTLPEAPRRPSAARIACRYRAPAIRVPAGVRVRLPLCALCGVRLGYMETADGAVFLHPTDPAFRFSLVETR
jgi:hypothetical protein